ncbi:hypothetical protein CLAFUW4_07652 [Fulvia fulva]|uniref:Uncharacterized protein n=1 Tax=Passalora fulva TaxID=5499 RepID=A0A9Q8LCI8_PASFU|nr:uncharacterized protein CLAFUR5_07780 [Fulvia fulva]KAK4629732.1 hypothetical protein CLAFUR4_07657 [Fulvia fulva]KAK4630433.1 hypothetical protein CLAFUR0_07657 [Fulvia fulva]UJO14869.1 hypothetical protein CLAFUR5_07780 [Fulvia fulva]WPV12387.1 hypothetical protein CLAFUW4_07652 [Fulvia fulva]WPV27965.1 hypothetical protein CLAFUW7_07653 [Fulvia fulva]
MPVSLDDINNLNCTRDLGPFGRRHGLWHGSADDSHHVLGRDGKVLGMDLSLGMVQAPHCQYNKDKRGGAFHAPQAIVLRIFTLQPVWMA